MYIITAKRMISGELLKQRNGFLIRRGHGSARPCSSSFNLTLPFAPVEFANFFANSGSEQNDHKTLQYREHEPSIPLAERVTSEFAY